MLKKLIYPSILAVVIWAILFFTRMGEDHYVLDSIWVTGLLVLLQGLLFWTTQEGVFDTIRWGVGKFTDMFRKETKYNMKYYEYVQIRRAKPKTAIWPSLLVGGLLFIVGVIWWVIIM